jgi:hypothetical protein
MTNPEIDTLSFSFGGARLPAGSLPKRRGSAD